MTKTRFNTFPTACVSGATRSKVLVATCNVISNLKLGNRRKCSNKILYLEQRNQKRFQKFQTATVKCRLILLDFIDRD